LHQFGFIREMGLTAEGVIIGTAETLEPGGIHFHLDRSLRLIKAAPSDAFLIAHKKAAATGAIDHSFSPAEAELLKAIERRSANP
jgi:hypothetical protein